MRKIKLFFACLLMAVLSIGQMWGAEGDVVYKLNTATTTIATANGYNKYGPASCASDQSGSAVSTASWKITLGSKQTGSPAGLWLGTNSGNASKMKISNGSLSEADAIATALGINADDTYYTALIGETNLPNVGKVTLTYSGYGNKNPTKAWILYSTDNGTSWSIAKNVTSLSNTGTDFEFDATIESARYAFVVNHTAWFSVKVPVLIFYEGATGGSGKCATPSFEPAAGAIASGTQVSITCSTDGADIHYTTDGTTPTASSPTYSSAITVSSAMTIKAIAVKDGLSDSDPATAAYTILEPKTIAQIMPSTTTEGDEFLLNDVTVTYAYGNYVYVKDASGYMLVYSSISGAANGKVLQGLQGKAKLYSQLPEISTVTKAPTVTDGSAVAPVALEAYPVVADLNKYVTMEGVTFASAATLSGSVTNVTGSFKGSDLIFRNTFKLSGVSLTAGTSYRVVGIVQKYNDNFQVYPISFEEIVSETQVATPTFLPAAGTYTSVQNVTISCETTGATIHYTTNGDEPTASSPAYSSAIEVGESMTIKAIAVKEGLDDSNVASAAYTINLPLPEHTFQVTHNFTTGEGFEFPTGWGGSYAEHEIAYTDDKVHFASASKQTGTITDRPVVKEGAISLILTNSHKLISAVRFDYSQWNDKVPTLTMKYSKDGGETYNNFDPVVSTTDFALQVLTMPEGVNAIQVVGTANKQTGLTSIAFDLEDKPIVTKTVTITTPSNGTLTVMNGEDAVSSGDEIEVNSVLTITATPDEGYILTEVTVNGSAYAESTLTLTENVTIAASFEENVAPDVNSYVLSEIGTETSQSITGLKVGDKVNLPLTATSCSKTFVGWDADENCATEPTYAPGAEYTLALDNKLYAVYADAGDATWSVATSVKAGDVVVISTNTGYTTHDMKTAGAISSSLMGCMASTYNADNSQITALAEGTLEFTVGGNATDGWTLMNGTKYLKVTAAKKVNLVDDEETWTISFSGNNATLAPKTGDYTGYSLLYNYNSGTDRFTAYNSAMTPISLYKQVASYENYSTDCQAAVATPTFSPVAGTYTEVQNVTISTETADATIYYTTNGDVPTTSSTLYEGAIEVAESKTIKAIAVKDGMANSAVATAAYTINLPLSTMDQIFAAATTAGSTATDANIQFNNWVVSGVSTNRKNVFVTDGTKGFIIFDNGGEMGFAVGDVLSGTVACKVQLYKGAAELTTLSSTTEGLNIAKEGVITPAVKAISALSGINTGAPVTINSVQFDGEFLTDGVNSIKPFNSLSAYDALENGKYYNVTGIYQQFDATKEILPRSAADIEEVNLEDPEISYTPASATIELGQSLPGTTFANPHELAISYSSNNEAVATVTDAGVISLAGGLGTAVITASFAGNATYAAANVTYSITVNPASVSENVVIIAEYDSKFYALTNSISNKTAAAVEVEKDGDKIVVPSNEAKVAIQWTKRTSGENTTFQDANDKYLKGVSNGGDLTVVDAVCNWSWNATDEYYYIGPRSFIYRESANGFKNYAVSNAGSSDYSTIAEVRVIDPANIVVTTKVDPELAFDPEEVTLTVGDAFVAPVLGYVEGFDGLADVTLESSNTNLAVVNEGVVSLVADATGTATITATFDGNNNYLAGSASYTITVNEAGDDLSGTWVLASSVAAGDKIIIMGANNADIYTMGKQNSNNRAAVASTLSEDVLNPGAATKVFTLVDAGGGKFAIQASNGNYLTSATSGTSNNLLEAADYDLDNAKWTISIEEGVASIVAAAGSKTVMQYNSGSTIFSCYGSASQKPVKIYKRDAAPTPVYETVRENLMAGNYYTVCLPKKVTAIKGASFWTLNSKSQDGATAYLEEETNNLPFAAGKPFIIQATAAQLEVVYEGDETNVAGTNGALHGTLVYMDAAALAAAGPNVYMLFSNELRPVGEDNHLDANRAYVKLNELNAVAEAPQSAPGKRVRAMPMQPQVATGMDALNASDAPAKVLINGQLFIIRGEKMFDAKGQLVK